MLGWANENGDFGPAIDLDEVFMWFQKAAEGGRAESQRRLGWAYEGGELGLATSHDVALMYFQKAAGGGDAVAQRRLGAAHDHGEFGLESNAEEALKWHQKAAESGYRDYQDSDFGLAINQRVPLMCFCACVRCVFQCN